MMIAIKEKSKADTSGHERKRTECDDESGHGCRRGRKMFQIYQRLVNE